MGVCANTMLAHASPGVPRRATSPRSSSGDGPVGAVLLRAGRRVGPRRRHHPGRRATATAGSSTAPRSGAAAPTTPTTGMCLARTNWDVPKHRGLTWFAVKIAAPGVTVQPDPGDQRRRRVLPGVLRRRRAERRRQSSARSTRAGRWPRPCSFFERGGGRDRRRAPPAAPARGRWPPTSSPWPAASGGDQDPAVRQLIARAHINDFVRRGARHAGVAALVRQSGEGDAGVAAYGKLASGTFGAAAGPHRHGDRPAAAPWRGRPGDIAGQTAARQLPQRPRPCSSPAAPTRCSATASASGCSGLPREPSFDTDVPFREVVRRAKDWSGKVTVK